MSATEGAPRSCRCCPLSHFSGLGTKQANFFTKPKIILEDGMDGPNQKPMCGSKILDRDLPVILYSGGDRCQNMPVRFIFFTLEWR
jgi:hypothetical protein